MWKFNCSLLKDIKYLDQVKDVIQSQKLKYMLPVYNPENLKNLNDENIQFVINYKQLLDLLLLEIRGMAIKCSTSIKKQEREQERKLLKDIETLEKKDCVQHLHSILVDKRIELEEIRNK